MADTNGTGRLNDHEERIARLAAARKELEDSSSVMAHLETKSAARETEHAEFIAQHEHVIRGIDDKLDALSDRSDEFMARHEQVVREIDDKLNALIDIVSRMQGGMESRPG